jgi:hypothetical protein
MGNPTNPRVVALVSSSLGVAGIGFAWFMAGRIGFQQQDPMHFGSWREPPRWARKLFGTVGGSISPYRLSVEVWGLTWAVGGLGVFATGNPPGPPLIQIIGLPMLAVVPGALVCWVVASVGQVLREWRKR